MSYSIQTIPRFDRNLKKLVKKYPSLKLEYFELIRTLKENPTLGTQIGRDCYKIRIAIASKGKGKSGGARVIANVVIIEKIVYLLAIYDKSEQDTISDKELQELLKFVDDINTF